MDAHATNHPQGPAPYATRAAESRGRLVPEPPPSMRTEFQRDRDRIIHSGAFRKLRNKTQVFIESEGDYYRTRLTHSLEVAQIARSVARTLGIDEDLTEALALAHDLGHTCFGHAGEEGLAEAMKAYGGFSHNEQTFRILTKLENHYPAFDGLNLTWETLEGVVKHNGPVAPEKLPPTVKGLDSIWDLETSTFAGPEAQVAAIADDIAYNTHDIDDGHRAGLFRIEDMEALPLFGPAVTDMRARYKDIAPDRLISQAVREVIGFMINDLLATTRKNLKTLQPKSAADIRHAKQAVVSFSFGMTQNVDQLREFLHARMYRHTKVNRICAKARHIVQDLFTFFMAEPSCLPGGWREPMQAATNDAARARVVADYIAGMTDRYAMSEHRKLFSPETIG
jgi:dGTPase